MSLERLVFKNPSDAARLELVAARENWTATHAEEAADAAPLEVVWVTNDRMGAVHYIEDQHAGFVYLQIEGPAATRLRELAIEEFDLWNFAEISALSYHAINETDSTCAVTLAALCAPDVPDARFRPLLQRGLSHRSARVRRQAVQVIAYPGWDEFRQPLAVIAENDPDPVVRDSAARLAAILTRRSDG